MIKLHNLFGNKSSPLILERVAVLFSWLTRKRQTNAFYLQYTKKVMFIPLLICACGTQISIHFNMVYHVYAFLICLKCYLSKFKNMHVFEFENVWMSVCMCMCASKIEMICNSFYILYTFNHIANMSKIMRKW